MRSTRILAAALLLALAAPALPAPNDGVATIGKQSITQEELDRAVGSRLMRLRTEEYSIKKTALDDLIAERLLAAEAAKRGITVEELLKTEVGGRISVPTREEVEPFYEGTKERFGGSKEEAIAQIIEGMKRQRIATRTAEYVKSLREAAGVKILLEPPRAKIDLAGPTRGNAKAPVTIVEFSDFECPFCSRAHQTMQKIEDKYGENVKFVFLDYPLAIHRTAPRAAAAARCAADQDKFWEMHDRFFSKSGGPVQDADIRKYATESGVDMAKFNTCLDSGKYADSWKEGQAAGAKLGVQSTPTFFVNGRMVVGAAPLESFASVIDEELARARPAGSAQAAK
ncbi:MAG TPA: thioredoxin domain-containing protein [Thermoanaerobaculia bacterium]|jgi:protein-disulfide isomerase|nr:thioredoxin domain-containing protein [Thermoanaerobaculia bacterium]